MSELATQPDTMTSAQAMAYLGVSRATFYRYLEDGRLPGFRIGRTWHFRKEKLDAIITQQEDRTQWRV